MLTSRLLQVPQESAAIDATQDTIRHGLDALGSLVEASGAGAPAGIDRRAKGIAAANALELARRLVWEARDRFEVVAASSGAALKAAGDAAVAGLAPGAASDYATRTLVEEGTRSQAARDVLLSLNGNVREAMTDKAAAVAADVVESMRNWEREIGRARLEAANPMRSGLDLAAVLERERAAATFRAKGLAWALGYWQELLRVDTDDRARWFIDTTRPWLGEVAASSPAKAAAARAAQGGRVDTGDDARDTAARLLREFERWESDHAPAWLLAAGQAYERAKALVRELIGVHQGFMTPDQFRRTYLSVDMRTPDALAVDAAWFVRRLPPFDGPGVPGYVAPYARRQAMRNGGA